MNAAPPSISDRIDEVRGRIAQAARRSGRDPGEIVLVGVVKTVPVERIREAVQAGLADLGENRIQEALRVVDMVGRRTARWHMIGHLQRNKAARAASLFDRIHGVDGAAVARALSRAAAAAALTLPVLIQVNVTGAATQSGVEPSAAPALAEEVARMPGLGLDGLMSIAPPVERAEDAREAFARTRRLRDALEDRIGIRLPVLSMGMSGDYEVAIEEGSTMVRVGTALFGSRGSRDREPCS